jgi:hypothetical protein
MAPAKRRFTLWFASAEVETNMGRVAYGRCFTSLRTIRSLAAAAGACVFSLSAGCLNLRSTPIELPLAPTAAPVPEQKSAEASEPALSGALDGPTLRLALRDLAVILDTLGRLDQVRPDLKPQMLRELADADAATAAAVVKRWRARLPEIQLAESTRVTLDDTKLLGNALSEYAPSETKAPVEQQASAPAVVEPARACAARLNGAGSPEEATSIIEAAPDGGDEPHGLPTWQDLLESLVGMTRDRADEFGPDAARARMQLTLLELVQRSQESSGTATPDPQLWSHLDPAIQYCFGPTPSNQPPPQEVVRSLQVATELLRGPGRFQVRGLAFCTRIRGFGNIDRVPSSAFGAGQAVLLYSEAENFFSDPEPGGFRTRLSSVVELLDAGGRQVWSQDFGVVEDCSSGPRRDYFLSYRFHLPSNVRPGVYSIRLTLRDEYAGRSASGAIALSIR